MIKTHTCWNKRSRRGDWWCVIAQLSSCSLTVEPVNMKLKPANASATYMHWIFLNSNAYMQYDGGKKIIIIWVFVFKNNAGCWLLLSRLLAPQIWHSFIYSTGCSGMSAVLQPFSSSLCLRLRGEIFAQWTFSLYSFYAVLSLSLHWLIHGNPLMSYTVFCRERQCV